MTSQYDQELDAILEYWFGSLDASEYPKDNSVLWWKKKAEVDATIAKRFSITLSRSKEGFLDDWRHSPKGRLAHIILVDQMSRNMHRDTGQMFAQDDLAQELSLLCLASGEQYAYYHERLFQYMPLMHAENRAMQRLCTHLFTLSLIHI